MPWLSSLLFIVVAMVVGVRRKTIELSYESPFCDLLSRSRRPFVPSLAKVFFHLHHSFLFPFAGGNP
jgi:hypothetical protein